MRRHPQGSSALARPQTDSLVAAVQPLLEKVASSGTVEDARVARAWEMYESPEVRFAARQYSGAFSSSKLILGRRETVGRDPVPIDEPQNAAENKAYELIQTFAGGPEGQTELLDRMGTYFVVPGDMILIGAYDPLRTLDSRFARWDVWSTSEVRWDGQRVHVQTEAVEDRFQIMPDYIKHVRVWNRHPRRGWQSDSPVLSSLEVLELIGLYDDRLAAEAISRLVGAGVWPIPQGMKLPTSTGDPAGGTPNDFLRLMMDVASLAIKDRRGPAATVPILVEAAAEDIAAMKDSHVSFSSKFDERIGELQQGAIRRWATGVDLPAEAMLGLSSATHWNASLITEDKVQSFIVPSLRRLVGNLTWGWLRPALGQFGHADGSLVVWFDPSGIKTRVDLGEETEWAHDRFLVGDEPTKYNLGLSQSASPTGEELKRMMLMRMARDVPEAIPDVLRELGIQVNIPGIAETGLRPRVGEPTAPGAAPLPAGLRTTGPQNGPQPTKRVTPANGAPGRDATLSTTEPK